MGTVKIRGGPATLPDGTASGSAAWSYDAHTLDAHGGCSRGLAAAETWRKGPALPPDHGEGTRLQVRAPLI